MARVFDTSTPCADQAALRKRIREIAENRIRYGYRCVYIMLRREGWKVNYKRVHRLYREEVLNLRRKRLRRHVTAVRSQHRVEAQATDDIWLMDFVLGGLFDERRFRALTLVDNFSRGCLSICSGQSIKESDVVEILDELAEGRGVPRSIRVENGPEFISKDLDLWAY